MDATTAERVVWGDATLVDDARGGASCRGVGGDERLVEAIGDDGGTGWEAGGRLLVSAVAVGEWSRSAYGWGR